MIEPQLTKDPQLGSAVPTAKNVVGPTLVHAVIPLPRGVHDGQNVLRYLRYKKSHT